MTEQRRTQVIEQAARLLGRDDETALRVLAGLWDEGFDQGRVQALDELQDRFCVCMK